MDKQEIFDVIIVGGSYAGLSAALALGRSLRTVLVIDNGNPCNSQAPHSHNFLTQDGNTPEGIRQAARKQVLQYPTVSLVEGTVEDVVQNEDSFKVNTSGNDTFFCRKIIFATGVIDTIPNVNGFAECWGKSVFHCPYCHGYEVKGKRLGVLANGDLAFELAKTIKHWAGTLTLYTNGTSTLSNEEVQLLNKHEVLVVENEITALLHENGQIKQLQFEDTENEDIDALFTQLPFIQQCNIPEKLGCEFNEHGFIQVSKSMETSVPGIYAAGDCLTLFRSVANAVAAGNKVGAMINKKFIEEEFSIV